MASLGFTLRQLEYFEAVATEGSLAAAAGLWHVTPSAITLALDELERHLGVQLVIRRKGRGVSLTAEGTRMLARARVVLSSAETLSADAARAADSVSGRLAVGCFTTLTPFYVPAIVDWFSRQHPAVELDVTTASAEQLQDQLALGRLDAALMYSVDVSPSLTFDPVAEHRPHALLPATHPLARGTAVSLAALEDEPFVMLDVSPARQNTEGIFTRLGLTMNLAHVSTSFEAVRCLVGAGLGYAVLFQRPATDTTYDGHAVRALDLTETVPPTVVGLARPAGAPRTARTEALRTFLVDRDRVRAGGAGRR